MASNAAPSASFPVAPLVAALRSVRKGVYVVIVTDALFVLYLLTLLSHNLDTTGAESLVYTGVKVFMALACLPVLRGLLQTSRSLPVGRPAVAASAICFALAAVARLFQDHFGGTVSDSNYLTMLLAPLFFQTLAVSAFLLYLRYLMLACGHVDLGQRFLRYFVLVPAAGGALLATPFVFVALLAPGLLFVPLAATMMLVLVVVSIGQSVERLSAASPSPDPAL